MGFMKRTQEIDERMKNLSLLVFLTQLGLSVALPLGGMILLAVWLYTRHGWGLWVIFVGAALGLVFAADGLRTTLRTMDKLAKDDDDDKPISFNEHD